MEPTLYSFQRRKSQATPRGTTSLFGLAMSSPCWWRWETVIPGKTMVQATAKQFACVSWRQRHQLYLQMSYSCQSWLLMLLRLARTVDIFSSHVQVCLVVDLFCISFPSTPPISLVQNVLAPLGKSDPFKSFHIRELDFLVFQGRPSTSGFQGGHPTHH